MTEPDPVFTARIDGYEPEDFDTLQEAVEFVEQVDTPTGAIEYDGLAVITYSDGDIEQAS